MSRNLYRCDECNATFDDLPDVCPGCGVDLTAGVDQQREDEALF